MNAHFSNFNRASGLNLRHHPGQVTGPEFKQPVKVVRHDYPRQRLDQPLFFAAFHFQYKQRPNCVSANTGKRHLVTEVTLYI